MRALLALLLFLPGLLAPSAAAQLLDRIVAVVDDDVVMASELEERLATIEARIRQSGAEPPPREVLAPQVLERLILERIQLAMAVRAGIRISDAELDQALAEVARSQGFPSTEAFLARARAEGMSEEAIREQLLTELMLTRLQQVQVNRRIQVTEQEIDNFLASEEGRLWDSPEVHLGHILLPLPANAPPDEVERTLAKARELIAELRAGADFRQLAIAHSADQSALEGGDLGWRRLAQLPALFIPVVEALAPGQVSEPVRSDAGVHILKLYERRGGEAQVITQSFVRHILLKPNEIRDDEATRRELAELARRIRAGEDFAALAKQYSEDLGSARSGGELGWSFPGKFVPEFERVVEELPLGAVSDPFRTRFGWHIVQVTERRNQDFTEELRRARAEAILRSRKYEEELQLWLREIRDRAYVEIKL
ncbi:MAG: chaperone SurA [Porticoccaceae bacterium]|nr:MAG: chaperone SurA [Porticoccaceae bacterium]